MSPPPSSHPGPAWRGEEVDDGCSLHLHSSYNFLSCHWLSVPLSDHTPLPPVPTPPTTTTSPPPSPPPHGPSLLRRLRLSLGCFEHSPPFALFFCFFFCSGRGPLSVVVLLHACPVFLHASSPPCRRHPKEVAAAAAVLVVVVVVFGQLTLLSPLCLQPSLFS